ncbi:MAG: hypothetical protein IKC52_01065 [Clostridia bacterium]|nr:hypothetical protein [Clostridia bacterium]
MKMFFLLLDFALQQQLEWMGFALPVLAHVGFEARCWAFCKRWNFCTTCA